jgi:ribosome-associated protein
MAGPLHVSARVVVPEHELTWRFSRAGGPGGQGVNTTDSRVELSFDVAGTSALGATLKARALQRLAGRLVDGVITVTASERRSQLRNREAALDRLGEILREAIAPPPKPRRATKPTKSATERRIAAKKRRSHIKTLRRTSTDE